MVKKTEQSSTHVTRVKAVDDSSTKKQVKKKSRAISTDASSKEEPEQSSSKKSHVRPFRAIGRYFKGSWQELRLVRWPNRQATWKMTAALLLFTGFFIVLIIILDAGFKYLFKIILGS